MGIQCVRMMTKAAKGDEGEEGGKDKSATCTR